MVGLFAGVYPSAEARIYLKYQTPKHSQGANSIFRTPDCHIIARAVRGYYLEVELVVKVR